MSWETRRRSWNAAQAEGPVEDRGVYHLDSKLSPTSSPTSSSRIHTSASSTPTGARRNSYRLASPSTSPLTQPSSSQSISDLQEVSSMPFGSSPTTVPRPSSPSTVPPEPFSRPPVAKPVVAEIPGDPSSHDYYEGVCLSSEYSVCGSWPKRYCMYRNVHANVRMRAHVYMSAQMHTGAPHSGPTQIRSESCTYKDAYAYSLDLSSFSFPLSQSWECQETRALATSKERTKAWCCDTTLTRTRRVEKRTWQSSFTCVRPMRY
jgi:hypothetical protein